MLNLSILTGNMYFKQGLKFYWEPDTAFLTLVLSAILSTQVKFCGLILGSL